MELLINGLVALLHLLAVALALYTIRISGRALAWLLLCAAFLLMAVRQVLEYLVAVGALETTAKHYAQDWLRPAVSLLIVAGIYHVRKIFVARTQAEKALAESEEKFHVIASAAHDAVVLIDAEGRIEVWNAAAEKIFGYSPAEALGQPMHELIVPERFRVEAGRGFGQFMESGQGPVIGKILELPAMRKGGSEFPSQHSISAVKVNGRWHAIGLIQDVTERKQAEDRIRAALAEKEVLLREIHHRVKSNMQVITSLLNIEIGRIADAGVVEALRESQHRIEVMAMVHEKLYRSADLARLNAKAYIEELTRSLFSAYRTGGANISLLLEVEQAEIGIDAAIPCGLVINELVSNALKHAFPEGRAGEVRVSLRPEGERGVLLTVADDGVGMPGDFDWRKAETLGLRLVQNLVEQQLQGRIELERARGTEWRIRFGG